MKAQTVSLPPQQDQHNDSQESPTASPGTGIYQPLDRTIRLLKQALFSVTEGRIAAERVSLLIQAKQLLQRHAWLDAELKLVDVENFRAVDFQQPEERIPDDLLQSLSHMTRRLTPVQKIRES